MIKDVWKKGDLVCPKCRSRDIIALSLRDRKCSKCGYVGFTTEFLGAYGDPSADGTTIYAQVKKRKIRV